MFCRRLTQQLISAAASFRFINITQIPMPALSPTMEKGKITEWVKKVGDSVAPGDTWCRVETDKAVVSYDNVAEEGFLARILLDVGVEATVGDTVCLVVEDAADVSSEDVKNWQPCSAAAKGTQQSHTDAFPSSSSSFISSSDASTRVAVSGDVRVKASPLARKTAQELGVSLENIRGTGGNVGRIVKRDVVEAAAAGTKKDAEKAPAAAKATVTPSSPSPLANDNYVDIPVSNMRATIARRLVQSKNVDAPHYYIFEECCVDNMLALIRQLNAKGDGKFKITVNDYIIKSLARANMLVPEANSSWQGEVIRQYNTVDVSVAVATPTGLITPIIKNAQIRGLADISTEMKLLAKRARDGELQPHEFIGGTVSLSNLGATGIIGFTAIINPPQALILAVGSAKPRPKITLNEATGKYEVGTETETIINFTASFDHRVVDGAVAAQWFKHFKDAIENPLSLML